MKEITARACLRRQDAIILENATYHLTPVHKIKILIPIIDTQHNKKIINILYSIKNILYNKTSI